MSPSPHADGEARLSGVILETAAGLRFVRAENALVALDNPRLSPLPGTRLELLWFEGHVVVAAAWPALTQEGAAEGAPARLRRAANGRKSGPERSALVCELAGQRLALTAVELVSSGRFELASGGGEANEAEERPVGVRYGEHVAPAVDLAALFATASALAQSSPGGEARAGDGGTGGARTSDGGSAETRDEPRNPGDSDPSPTAPDDTK